MISTKLSWFDSQYILTPVEQWRSFIQRRKQYFRGTLIQVEKLLQKLLEIHPAVHLTLLKNILIYITPNFLSRIPKCKRKPFYSTRCWRTRIYLKYLLKCTFNKLEIKIYNFKYYGQIGSLTVGRSIRTCDRLEKIIHALDSYWKLDALESIIINDNTLLEM